MSDPRDDDIPDVANPGGLPVIVHDGVPRVLACLRPKAKSGRPRYADHFPVLPRSEWVEQSLEAWNPAILDQGQTSSCVGHGAAGGFGLAWQVSGRTPHRFSACYLYGLINGGFDNGAVVQDAMSALVNIGICLEETVPEGVLYHSQVPPAADAEAGRFRLFEAYECSSFDEICSALVLNRPVVYGIDIGTGFADLDSEGVSGFGPIEGGHCQFLLGIKRSPRWGWILRNQNSWGPSFGDGGRCYVTEQHGVGAAGYGAFAIVAPAEDPQETSRPPR